MNRRSLLRAVPALAVLPVVPLLGGGLPPEEKTDLDPEWDAKISYIARMPNGSVVGRAVVVRGLWVPRETPLDLADEYAITEGLIGRYQDAPVAKRFATAGEVLAFDLNRRARNV